MRFGARFAGRRDDSMLARSNVYFVLHFLLACDLPGASTEVENETRHPDCTDGAIHGDDRPRRLLHSDGHGVHPDLDGMGHGQEVPRMAQREAVRGWFGAVGAGGAALDGDDRPPRRASAVRRRRTSTGPIPPDWQPDEGWISQCRQHDIPEDFIRAQRDRFVLIWQERGESRFSWGNEFVREVLRRWREEQSAAGARERFSDMGRQWQPDAVAVEILLRDGVNDNFIKDAIPEFVLYWTEKGVMQDAWNSKFIAHVQRQWLRLRSAELDGKTPRPLAADWKPNAACLEILQMARIDEGWALQELAEFVLYWRDTGEARESWNIIFLQRMKQVWAQRLKRQELEEANARPELAGGSVEADDQAWRQRVSDRSWAE